jgi:hypothetical protein
MDRLSWYQTGESMEEILCQAGSVGIYDGDLKQASFLNFILYLQIFFVNFSHLLNKARHR